MSETLILFRTEKVANSYFLRFKLKPFPALIKDNNLFTDLQDRQRAPQKQLSRCLENRTRIESPMSGISDEEVDYGSFESSFNPSTDSNHQWSTSENDS